jgi:hypothetical protein
LRFCLSTERKNRFSQAPSISLTFVFGIVASRDGVGFEAFASRCVPGISNWSRALYPSEPLRAKRSVPVQALLATREQYAFPERLAIKNGLIRRRYRPML